MHDRAHARPVDLRGVRGRPAFDIPLKVRRLTAPDRSERISSAVRNDGVR